MKRYISVITATFIAIVGMLVTGCSNSKANAEENVKKLVSCLELTKNVESVEADLTTNSKAEGQTIDIKMNIKAEDIKGNMKSKVAMDISGQHQEFYMSLTDGKGTIYVDDGTGKYLSQTVSSSELGDMDLTRSFSAYIEIIQGNSSMLSKVSDNKYKLDIPKEKASEFYSKVTGKALEYSFDKLTIEFVIGSDNYLQTVILKASYNSASIDLTTEYSNYGKKFNIELPEV